MSRSTNQPNTTTASKRPFQDITDRFRIEPAPTPPTTRPRRKPKTPGGALGEKLRLRGIETTKSATNIFPSSLPPSSPPLYSSSSRDVPLDLNSEDEVIQEIQEDDDEPVYGRDDFGSILPSDDDADDDAENRAPANLSDPFGFFAVERKLKTKRDVLPLQPTVLRTSRYVDDKERDDGRVMPSTPHKPKVGKPRVSTHADVFSEATTSLPSTPSPTKQVQDSSRARGQESLEEADMETEVEERRAPRPRAKGKSRETEQNDEAAPRRKKARRSDSPVNPRDLVLGLEVVLPMRRSTRARSKAASKDDSQPKTRARNAPAKAKPAAKGRGKKKANEDNEMDHDDDREKWEAERQARLEYFRKLDDYSFEKENVYVV
ncbi:hypothetical protein B0H10DRAFT_2207126 [Mycena sp. CBHHK59/15]|nr:hypothetical protein B0H10DRAFT_2207126 [Mycena sp. CBHHK59/15]